MAICIAHPDDSGPILCESTTLIREPCLVTSRRTHGLQCHEILPRVMGHVGRVWLYKLAKPLTEEQSRHLTRYAVSHLGRGVRYDIQGAVESRTLALGWLQRKLLKRREDISSMFCSEWCASALRVVGAFHTENVSLYSPNSLARELVRRGVCLPPVDIKREFRRAQQEVLGHMPVNPSDE